jgi:hypothetical protein
MKRIIAGVVLLCVCYVVLEDSFTRDFTSSIIPGWNTTIQPWFWGASAVIPWIMFVVITYFLFLKRVINKGSRNAYLYMTVPFLITNLIASFVVRTILNEPLSIIGWTPMVMLSLLLFILAQIAFIIKLFRYAIKKPQ